MPWTPGPDESFVIHEKQNSGLFSVVLQFRAYATNNLERQVPACAPEELVLLRGYLTG